MLKQTTYQEKFNRLSHWMPMIMKVVKKDLKSEHLKKDIHFARHYLAGRDPNKLTDEEFAVIYSDAIANNEKGELLGDYIANRWVMKNGDIYHYFANELNKISPDFNELELLDKNDALRLMNGAIQEFGAPDTFLFSIINSVVFPEEIFVALEKQAKDEFSHRKTEMIEQKKVEDFESMQRKYDQQLSRLTDKYEKKLQGMQKKYQTDVSLLKNQVADLQRKMSVKA